MVSDRIECFGDDSLLLNASVLPDIVANAPFFCGRTVMMRMDAVREIIKLIRSNWNRYDDFLEKSKGIIDQKWAEDRDVMEFFLCISSRRNWHDVETPGFNKTNDFKVLRAYTSKKTYGKIFARMNEIFKSGSLNNDYDKIIGATFINELLNIDLYNYIAKNKKAADFTGTVYRGMCLEYDEVGYMLKIANSGIESRFISVPLCFQSASENLSEAVRFCEYRLSYREKAVPIILRIHVAGLHSDDLQYFRKCFSSGIVTSLCAVPINDVSESKKEKEVLLRGAFFQILNFHELPLLSIKGKPVFLMEVFMLNTNRDHLTTPMDCGNEVQKLMALLVQKKRHEFCELYYLTGNMKDLADAHRSELNIVNEKIKATKQI